MTAYNLAAVMAFKKAGFSLAETGGSCTAWRRETAAGQIIFVTGQDGCSAELEPGESYLVGIHADMTTLGDCSPGSDPMDAIGAAVTLERQHAPRQPLTAADLYNCLTDHAAPDWANWTRLELSGVSLNRQPDGSTQCQAGQSARVADIFTVYGIQHGTGYADAITDCYTGRDALAVACHLVALSGLPLTLDANLMLAGPVGV